MSRWTRGGYEHPCRRKGLRGPWEKLRRQWLARYPLCAVCGRPASHVDHIVPLKNWEKVGKKELLNEKNLQSLCSADHAEKTRLENMKYRPPKFCECYHPYVDGKPICGKDACLAASAGT